MVLERQKARIYRLLRWSEKYTKTDMVYLTHGGFWLATGQGISALSGFIIALVFGNLLSPEVYGNYRYILSIAGLLGVFSLSGLGTSLAQAVARGETGLLSTSARLQGFSSLSTTFIASIGATYYWLNGNHTLSLGLVCIGITAPFLNAYTLYSTFLYSKKEYARLAYYTGILNLGNTAGMIGAVLLTHTNVLALVATYFSLQILFNGTFFLMTTRLYPETPRSAQSIVPYAFHMSLMNILTVVAQQIDKVLLFTTTGGAPLAVYAFAIAIPEQMRALLKSVARLAFPKFAERPLAEIKRTLPLKLLLLGGGMVGASLLYVAIAPFFFSIFLPQYMESVWYSQLMALTLFTAIGGIPVSALQAHAVKRELYIYTIATSVVQIALTVVLVLNHGLWGAVLANILNRVAGLLIPIALLYTSKSQ